MNHDEKPEDPEDLGVPAGPCAGATDADGTGRDHGLSDDEVAILKLEQSWWKHPGAKETAVQDRFGWTMTRYYQVLNALIDTPAALAHDPVTVNRLRRLRGTRQRARQARPEQMPDQGA